MPLWDSLVDILLPLGLQLAMIAQAHQRAMQKIQPELDALRTHQRNPRRLAEEIGALATLFTLEGWLVQRRVQLAA